MKKICTGLLILLSMVIAANAGAQSIGRIGLGGMLGEPTGFSFKAWLDNVNAIDAGFGWSFSENDSFHFHADYLWHRSDIITSSEFRGTLPLYFGVGGRIKSEDDDGEGRNEDDIIAGVRIPVGISYLFVGSPVELFGEIVPVLDFTPDIEVDFNAAIGARYYF